MRQLLLFIALQLCALVTHGGNWVFNNPYPDSEEKENIFYSSFNEQPKTLDPARSYSSNEYVFIAQIYEPILEYDYYARPYQLIPLTSTSMPVIRYLDSQGNTISLKEGTVPAFTVYSIEIQKGILYQPHPAFAKKKDGSYRYHHLPESYLEDKDISKLSDFKHTDTRELIVDDFIYEIKRLANPSVSSSIYGLISDYIVGFKEFGSSLPPGSAHEGVYVDLRNYPLKGIKKIDDYHFEITLRGQYPQFLYWLAMPFFAPIPWEADVFYSQKGMDDKNLTFGWYPVGTGPFMLTANNPNRNMILEKNPNYREVYFPSDASLSDKKEGYVKNIGKRLPLIDKAVYTLEKESIPRWNKFLQGYYDTSDVSADSFDQAIRINRIGEAVLSPEMRAKKIDLIESLEPYIYYTGFNMQDNVVGGYSTKAKKLRQAISIAINYDEMIAIFYNGRGLPAQGPIPPGIFGYREGQLGMNSKIYQWKDNRYQRRSIEEANQLMKEAGYPKGIDPKTGQALILSYDAALTGNPDENSRLDWLRKQFAKIGIDLNVQPTLYNRFQDKIRTGNTQMFSWGWNADYPDPENFLFLLYGRNGKVKYGGENASNYNNPEFDQLFDKMKNRENDEIRQQLIDRMLAIVTDDAPWVWGMHPEEFNLSQHWVSHVKLNTISLGMLKYISIDAPERNKLRIDWNHPIIWPLALMIFLILLLALPMVFAYFKQEKQAAKRSNL